MKLTSFAVFLAVFAVLVFTQTIDQHAKNKMVVLENFQFSNYTGDGITTQMVSNYHKLISNAYSFYGNDTNKATDYISRQLESSYGYTYSVVILQSNQTLGSFLLYCAGGDSVISWTQTNPYQLNWRYIIWATYKYSSQTTSFIGSLGKGIGIDSQKESIIRSIVKAQQSIFSPCVCSNMGMSQITGKLKEFDGQLWSIICKKYSALNYQSLLKSNNYQYIQVNVNTGKCEYVLVTDSNSNLEQE